MKKCISCTIELTNENWSDSAKVKRYYICKECSAKKTSEYRNNHPWVTRAYNIKRRAEVDGINWELTSEDVFYLISSPCRYCGQILEKFNGIDRIDSSFGYVSNNVVSCCKWCNWAKNSMSIDEFKKQIKKISDYLGINKEIDE